MNKANYTSRPAVVFSPVMMIRDGFPSRGEETYNVGIEIQDLKTLPFDADTIP